MGRDLAALWLRLGLGDDIEYLDIWIAHNSQILRGIYLGRKLGTGWIAVFLITAASPNASGKP